MALGLFALLQNLDVLIVRSLATERVASDYAAVSVAAKALIWVAIGLGMFLLPEASRRAEQGLDGRPMLARTLALTAAAGLAATVIFALFGETILELAFGDDLAQGAAALPWLTLAMSLLAGVYLTVQFLLALRGRRFLVVLASPWWRRRRRCCVVGAQLTEVAIAVAVVDALLFAAVAVAAIPGGRALAAEASRRGQRRRRSCRPRGGLTACGSWWPPGRGLPGGSGRNLLDLVDALDTPPVVCVPEGPVAAARGSAACR